MADPNTQQQNEQDAQQDTTIQQRISIGNAYASLLGSATNQTFAAYTFEDALSQQITAIQGPGDDAHPNQLNAVARILSQLTQAVDEVSKIDPSQFQQSDDQNVNTPQDPTA
jgi:hypothetical protein